MDLCIRYKTDDDAFHETHERNNNDFSLDITNKDGRTTVLLHPKRKLMLQEAVIRIPYDYSDVKTVFLNGYQSWTDSREYYLNENLRNIRQMNRLIRERYHFEAYGDAWFLKYRKGEPHGITLAYLKKNNGTTEFFGSLNEEHAYLILRIQRRENTLSLESDCRGRIVTEDYPLFDFVRYRGTANRLVRAYFSHFGTCDAPPVRGYTSWYLDYQNISEKKMLRTLSSIDPELFDLFQIDDGYETFVGDWLECDPGKFPNGLENIAAKIKEKGLRAGIWLAPFVCETKSRVYREHPEWIVRKKDGSAVFAGSNWSGFVPLDLRRQDVRDYIRTCLEHYVKAGFTFFKLDFLYAAAMGEHHGHTRAEKMRFAMSFLRSCLPDQAILGCGVPLSSAFGLVDYCRIGPDVSLSFDDVPYMRLAHRERISTKVTLQNTIFRSCMDGTVFRCDPDVFLLRDERIQLSSEQKRALTVLNHLCGAVYMTSDDPGGYDSEKREILAEARKWTRARVVGILRDGPVLNIRCVLDGKLHTLRYHTKKGVLLPEE